MSYGLAKIFQNSNIPIIYHGTKISEVDKSGNLLAYVKSEAFVKDITKGKGIRISGDDKHFEKDVACYCLAKSVIARDITPFVLHLRDFEKERDDPDSLMWDASVIVLPDFDNPHFSKNPLHEDTLQLLVTSGKTFIYTLSKNSNWWSEYIISRLEKKTQEFIITMIETRLVR